MADVTYASRLAYEEHVVSGRATKQKDRIMRYFYGIRRPVTRHEAFNRYFSVHHSAGLVALDGGPAIPWNSLTATIRGLKCIVPDCDHAKCRGYLMIDHHGPDPVTGSSEVEFLVPIRDTWHQRRIF